jgi:4-hydroxy-tetrahydrodipicolinate synthase
MDYSKNDAKEWAKENLKGQWTTMITPFTKDDELDEEGLRRNIEHVIKLGVAGMGFSWNMGEFWSLTPDERTRLMEIVPEMVNDRAKIAFQVTSTSLKEVISMSNKASGLGYDFVIIAPPFIMTKSEEQVIRFVSSAAEKTEIGMAFYNSPQFGIVMSARGLSRLAEIKNLIAIKEASFNMQLGIDTHLLAGEKAVVSVPDEEIFFFEEYYGIRQQVMFANTSDWRFDTTDSNNYVRFINLATSGRLREAKELYSKIKPIKMVSRKWWSRLAARTGGALPVQMAKYWGELMGMSGGHVRIPLLQMEDQEKQELKKDLQGLGLVRR